jgi:hypothetical protein
MTPASSPNANEFFNSLLGLAVPEAIRLRADEVIE